MFFPNFWRHQNSNPERLTNPKYNKWKKSMIRHVIVKEENARHKSSKKHPEGKDNSPIVIRLRLDFSISAKGTGRQWNCQPGITYQV